MAQLRGEALGHPSAAHREGQRARRLVDAARERIAAALGVPTREIVFCSSATEALQLGLCGAAGASTRRRVVVSSIEHLAIRGAAATLQAQGYEPEFVGVERGGHVEASRFAASCASDTAAAALIHVHHETGCVQPIDAVAEACVAHGTPLICDTTLSLGRVELPRRVPGLLLVGSGAKIGAPAGVAWLRVPRGTELAIPQGGGPEEGGLRSGALDPVGLAALALRTEQVLDSSPARQADGAVWRDALLDALRVVPDVHRLGNAPQVPTIITLTLGRVHGEAMVMSLDLDGIAASTGAPCALGGRDPSPSLVAMGMSARDATATLRLSTDGTATPHDAEQLAGSFREIFERLKSFSTG